MLESRSGDSSCIGQKVATNHGSGRTHSQRTHVEATPERDSADVVEHALAEALHAAASAGQWEVVSQLARELEARREGVQGQRGAVQLAAVRKLDAG